MTDATKVETPKIAEMVYVEGASVDEESGDVVVHVRLATSTHGGEYDVRIPVDDALKLGPEELRTRAVVEALSELESLAHGPTSKLGRAHKLARSVEPTGVVLEGDLLAEARKLAPSKRAAREESARRAAETAARAAAEAAAETAARAAAEAEAAAARAAALASDDPEVREG
jgi:hypothetical protein